MDTSGLTWQTGLTGILNMAQGGAFGSDASRLVNRVIAPKNPIASPNPAPPPAPVAGQQGVNPPPSGGFMDHLGDHWGKYALAGGVLVLVFVGVKFARR
jgi:hypothetical protein